MKQVICILLFTTISLAASVDSYIRKELNEYNKFTYEVVNLPRDIDSISDPKIQIDRDREFKVKNGYAYVPVVISTGENFSRALITLRVKLYKEVLVAVRKIKSNEKIMHSDFKTEELEVTNLFDVPLGVGETLSGFRASVTINPGDILQNYMIEKTPIIFRGEILKAFAEYGSVVVEFNVTAREDGYKGKKIRVLRDDKKLFHAEVIDSKSVIIRE